MATEQAQALSSDVGRLLLYVPTVAPTEFDVAISYLVRRLEENAASENFMSGIFDLAPGSDAFVREAGRFHSAVEELGKLSPPTRRSPAPTTIRIVPHRSRLRCRSCPPSCRRSTTSPTPTPRCRPTRPGRARPSLWPPLQGGLDTVAVPAVIADDEVDDVIATARAAPLIGRHARRPSGRRSPSAPPTCWPAVAVG